MIDGFTLQNELKEALKNVDKRVSDMKRLGRNKADARRVYRIKKSQKIVELRDQGMAATVIPDVVNGNEEIAWLKFNLELAETEYDANFQAILYWKKCVDALREQMDREWNRQ